MPIPGSSFVRVCPQVVRSARRGLRGNDSVMSRGSTLSMAFHAADVQSSGEDERLEKALAAARHENRRLREALSHGTMEHCHTESIILVYNIRVAGRFRPNTYVLICVKQV